MFPLYLAVIALSYAVYPEESIRCDGRLISPGDTYIKVLKMCGEPNQKVEYSAVFKIHQRFIVETSTQRRQLVDTFKVDIPGEKNSPDDTGDPDEIDDDEFHHHLDSTYSIDSPRNFSYKGYNVQRTINNLALAQSINARFVFWETSIINNKMQKLVYNRGPTRFVQVLIFKNGILEKLETTEYGF